MNEISPEVRTALREMAMITAQSTTTDPALRISALLAHTLLEICQGRAAFVLTKSPDSSAMGRFFIRHIPTRGALTQESKWQEIQKASGLAFRTMKRKSLRVIEAPATTRGFRRDLDWVPGVRSGVLVLIPIAWRGEPLGTAGVIVPCREAENVRHIEPILSSLAGQAGASLLAARALSRAHELAMTDELTGAFNYRFLIQALEREVRLATRFSQEFSIIMMDVDHLKEHNDAHGHLRGSEVLRQIAHITKTRLRRVDILTKYGGDEFLVILPQTPIEGAVEAAERLRQGVEKYPFCGEEESGRITASLGLATFPRDGKTVRGLLEAVDVALYEAKRGGRNCLRVAGHKAPRKAGAGGTRKSHTKKR